MKLISAWIELHKKIAYGALAVCGERKVFNVAPFLDKGIFVELKDENYFKQVRVAFGSIEWLHEQNFSRDTLYLLGTPLKT